MSFAGYFLSVLFCLLSMLISDSRFDLVWFRLSCDHGWIRSGSVNVRKQQQQHRTANTGPAASAADRLPDDVVTAGEALHYGTAVGEVASPSWFRS